MHFLDLHFQKKRKEFVYFAQKNKKQELANFDKRYVFLRFFINKTPLLCANYEKAQRSDAYAEADQ